MTVTLPSLEEIDALVADACRDAPAPELDRIIRDQMAQDAGRMRGYTPAIHMAGQCPRQLSYRALGVPPSDPIDPRMAIVWRTGDAIEQVIDEYLRRTGLYITYYQRRVRIPFSGGVIFGQLDRIIEPDTVLDIKSINTYGYDEVLRSGPKTEHVCQVTLYIHALRLDGHTQFSKGALLYVDKNNGAVQVHGIRYSEPLAHALIAIFEAVHAAATTGQLLPRPAGYTPSSYPCSYCRWRTACWVPATQDSPQTTEHAADLSHLDEAMRRYLELSNTRNAIEQDMAQIRSRVQAALVDAGATQGYSPSCQATLIVQHRREVDLSQLPPLAVQNATTLKPVHVLRITHRTPPRAAHGSVESQEDGRP